MKGNKSLDERNKETEGETERKDIKAVVPSSEKERGGENFMSERRTDQMFT